MNRDFAEMLNALSADRVEFLVVGAYAVAGHGLPRATGDIDLWVRPSAENAARLTSVRSQAPGRRQARCRRRQRSRCGRRGGGRNGGRNGDDGRPGGETKTNDGMSGRKRKPEHGLPLGGETGTDSRGDMKQ